MNLLPFQMSFTRLLIAFLLISCGIFLVGHSFSDQPSGHRAHKPVSDFSFLNRFIPISDLFSEEQWHDNKGRSFDSLGVHLTNSKKHPVNACHYALFCYDEYKATRDTRYYNGFINQVRYLMDPTSYHEPDTDKIAYPYYITFHDLKPPWYSALAQSEAMSVLIRYYALTRDTAALTVLTRIRNFMVSPQEFNCGTQSRTPEGYVWYEEYPNSKQERQVLNGFYLAIVALYEYSNLFPTDTASRRMYEEAIVTAKKSFPFYDTGTWLKYNRGDGRQVGNGYMKWQVLELKMLYEITGDIYFKQLMMLVSSYCYDKPYETPGCKLEHYDFSVPLSLNDDGILEFKGKNQQITISASTATVTTSYSVKNHEITKMTDSNINSFMILKHNDSLKKDDHFIEVKFKKRQSIASCRISYAGLDSLEKPPFRLFYKTSPEQKQWQKLSVTSVVTDPRTNQYFFTPVDAAVISFQLPDARKFKEFRISNLAVYEPSKFEKSDFQHYITPVYESAGGTVQLHFEEKGMKSVAVFYKGSADAKSIDREKWDTANVHTKSPVVINGNRKKFHRFLIIVEPEKPAARLGKLKFIS